MPCARGCCATPAEHYRSIGMRARMPGPKVTRHDTDTAVVTETAHFSVDRQDTHVAMRDATGLTVEAPMPAKYERKVRP